MKFLTKNQIFDDMLYLQVGRSWWGYKFDYDIIYYYKNFVFFDFKNIFLKIKKVLRLIFYISRLNGICLSFFSDFFKIEYKNIFEIKKIKNFYYIFINKLFGFLSNMNIFLKKDVKKKLEYYTNYNSRRIPSIVFVSKDCLKNNDNLFILFIKLRIIVIRSNQFIYHNLKNSGYDITINDCFIFYNNLKIIYMINDTIKKIW